MSLTNEDKQWFEGALNRLETTFDGKLERLEIRFDQKLEGIETRFDQKIEGLETRLLTEFHKWASPTTARIRSHSAALRALDLQIEALADRVTKLEKPH